MIKFIEKGKPYQNGYMERFNRSFLEEVLDAFSFTRINEAQVMANAWIWIYNNERPHSSFGYRTPRAFTQERRRIVEPETFLPDRSIEWKSLVLSDTN